MGKEPLIEKWKRGDRAGVRIAEVLPELERLGFTVEQGTKHVKARHPGLESHPNWGSQTVVLSAHHRGRPGQVAPDSLSLIVKAVKWIEENENPD